MKEIASDPSTGPLEAGQRAELRRWQRRMILAFVISVISLVGVMGIGLIFKPGEVVGAALLMGLLALVLVSVRIQFSQTCPACGVRLGLQTRLLLPARCRRCGVAFREKDGS